MRCKPNVYQSNTYTCKYLLSANTYLLTFYAQGHFIFASIFWNWLWMQDYPHSYLIFLSPSLLFFLNYTFPGVCPRESGCSQRRGMLRSVSARGNKMRFYWKLLQEKEKDWGGIWSIKSHVSPAPRCEFSSSLQSVLICVSCPHFQK